MTAAGLVLAAGAGRRLGRPKALVDIHGELLVDRAVRAAAAAGCAPVVVVLGAAAAEVTARGRLDDAVVVVNDAWTDGMGSSLRCGLRMVAELGATAALVTVVDQPAVGPELLRRLLDQEGTAAAVAASYAGEARSPVLIDAGVFDEVCALAGGDVGARAWMRIHPGRVRAIACDDLGDGDDVDTAEDLTRFLEGLG